MGDCFEGGEEEISFCWEVLLDWAYYGCNTLRTLFLPLIKAIEVLLYALVSMMYCDNCIFDLC